MAVWVLLAAFAAAFGAATASGAEAGSNPVLQCHTKDPTADKPQSKLWYAHGRWWAWLPSGSSGSRVWRRLGPGRWQAEAHLDAALSLLPGRADVWAGGDRVAAALVGGKELAVVALRWDRATGRYVPAGRPQQWRERSDVETVTIDRADCGCFWVAYPVNAKKGREVVARRCGPRLDWPLSEPVTLAAGLGRDEICAATALGDTIGVMWSDQKRETVLFRRHPVHAADVAWPEAEVVAKGSRTADDHINFCRPREEGAPRLLAATKTSLDTVGKPIFSLRVLSNGGQWRSVPFGVLGKGTDLTRPIVLWVGGRPIAVYTTRNPPGKGFGYGARFSVISVQEFSADGLRTQGPPRDVIRAARPVNNVTGPKAAPPGAACVVLASDGAGGVYEGLVETRN